MIRSLLLGALAALAAAPAFAGVPVTLRPEPVDADGKVTLGELFDGATGPAAAVVVATRTGPSVVLDAGQTQIVAHRAGLDWTNDQGLRRIIVREGAAPALAAAAKASAGSAAASGNVQVLTWARSLAAGEVVQPQDLIWSKAAAAPLGAAADPDALIGQAARRPLREGAAAAIRDVVATPVIKNGDVISVTYSMDGVSLTLQAKALADAAKGEPVAVQNTSSKKTIQAIAAGPGLALVGPEADRLRAARPVTVASR